MLVVGWLGLRGWLPVTSGFVQDDLLFHVVQQGLQRRMVVIQLLRGLKTFVIQQGQVSRLLLLLQKEATTTRRSRRRRLVQQRGPQRLWLKIQGASSSIRGVLGGGIIVVWQSVVVVGGGGGHVEGGGVVVVGNHVQQQILFHHLFHRGGPGECRWQSSSRRGR